MVYIFDDPTRDRVREVRLDGERVSLVIAADTEAGRLARFDEAADFAVRELTGRVELIV